MDPIQTMPAHDAMTKAEYTPAEWLTYYKNIWTRNLIARTIDMQSDTLLKASDPKGEVMSDEGRPIPVAARLEHRKILVQDALTLLGAINSLGAIKPDEFIEKFWSKEALAVAPDMIPPTAPEEVVMGGPCKIDGKDGKYMPSGKDGELVCMPITEEAKPAEAVNEGEGEAAGV